MKVFWIVLISVIVGIVTGLATATWRVGRVDMAAQPSSDDGQPPCCGGRHDGTPRVEVDERVFQFGTMDVNAQQQHEFILRNTGDAPLELTAGDTSCSCTVSELRQNTIAPGESTAVVMMWHANGSLGPYRQTAVIHTNDPEQPRLELAVEGEIMQSLRAVPTSLHFGRIPVDQTVDGQVTLLCLLDEQLKIIGHEMANDDLARFFEVTHESIPVDAEEYPEAKAAVRVGVYLKPGLPPGAFRQTINLRTSLPSAPEFPIEVEGHVVGDISIVGIGPGWNSEHNLFQLGNVPSGKGESRRLLLVARGEYRDRVEFTIERVQPEWLEVTLGEPRTLASGVVTQTPLTITIPKDSPPAAYLGSQQGGLAEVRLRTNHPTTPELRIRLRFAVVEGG